MKTGLVVAALVTATVIVSTPALAQPAASAPAPRHVPVLAYSSYGGFPPSDTIAELLVYSTGTALLVRVAGGDCLGFASAHQIAELQGQLAAAGAFFLGDGEGGPPDLPIITVTYFVPIGNTGRARSNSFTYTVFSTGAAYAKVEQAVESFVTDVFPTC